MVKTEAFENSTLFMGLTTKNGYKAGKLYSLKASDGDGDFVWDRNSTAYRLNQEGVLEAMVTDVPRVDYTNTCPELLIEKQSTNLLLRSQEFNNASWLKSGISVTANTDVSPDGTTTADLVTNTSSVESLFYQSLTTSGVNTLSIYAKAGTSGFIFLQIKSTTGVDYIAIFNLSTGAFTGNGGFTTPTYYGSKLLNNGYRRYYISNDVGASGTALGVYGSCQSGTSLFPTNGQTTIFWGAQLEALPFATSYIPTTSASVTRVRDIATNITTDFTGLVGTIFVRARVEDSSFVKDDTILSLWGEDTDHYILIYSDKDRNIKISTYENPDQNDYSYALASDGICNIAVGYDFSGANNKLNIAINGVLKRANATQGNNAPIILNTLELGNLIGTLPQIDNRIIGVMWFDSQLSDLDIVNITA